MLLGTLARCGAPDAPQTLSPPPLPWTPTPFPALPHPAANGPSAAKVELGWLLFHDPLLSRDRATACVSCHGQNWGLSDGLRVSIGVDSNGASGLARRGPHRSRRNAPALWNLAWRQELFWDGRAPSLEAQALGPLTDPDELARDPDALARDLDAIPEYRQRFALAFPGDRPAVSIPHLQRALGAFERTLVSDLAPYDRYAAGDPGALSPAERRGMEHFAVAGCPSCHPAPLFFSGRYAPAPGPVPGEPAAAPLPWADLGRYEVTRDPRDLGHFRAASLRNLRESAPYFHDGSSDTLDGALQRELHARSSAPLDASQRADLLAFLRDALHDRTRMPPHAERVPSGLPVPRDDYRPGR